MKITLVILTLVTGLLLTACETGRTVSSGPASGVKSQSTHAGNSGGSMTQ